MTKPYIEGGVHSIMRYLLLYHILVSYVAANVEKTIFVAPSAADAVQDASIDNLLLMSLHPEQLTIRTHLDAIFPTQGHPHGMETWAILDGLKPGQRHELRICWLATQPTAFWLDTFGMQEVFENPELTSSLTQYSNSRRAKLTQADVDALLNGKYKPGSSEAQYSFLFLRVQAAADYFSMNKTLMTDVPPVHVDLILDPYLLNVFPQSLLWTAGYIGAIAILAVILARWIYQQMISYIDGKFDAPVELELKKTE